VKLYRKPEAPSNGGSLLSKLENIKIEGPEDFSGNLDLYLSGEKTIG
jgi:hypothetical protein